MTKAHALPLALFIGTLMGGTALAEVPRVVASIKPVHALVASVMGDLGTPDLLVSGGASPHTYSLRPSDARALQAADIVFWTGHGMEMFLADSLDTLAPGATQVELSEAPGLTLLPVREGGMFEGHDHGGDGHDDHAHDDHAHDDHAQEAHGHDDHDHDAHGHDDHAHDDHDHGHDHDDHAHADEAGHDHAHGDDAAHDHDHGDDHGHEHGHDHGHEHDHDHDHGADMHFFLDPANAVLMTRAIAETLSAADPDNAATYAANAEATIADLDALAAETAARLAPYAGRPIVVFHDAYQYFGARFGLDIVGSVTVSPEIAPGADRIAQIRDKLQDLSAACVYAEPQFDPRIIDVLVEGSDAKAGVLDPEGANIEPGPGLYRQLVTNLADGIIDCLE